MFDIDWFLSILKKEDMEYICRKFKLSVTGFQRNLTRAPISTLGNTIKTALSNGFRKKKGNKNNYLPLDEFMNTIACELIKKYPFIPDFEFLEFAEQAELELVMREYEIVAVSYKYFEIEFKKYYTEVVNNTKNNRYIYHGITKELSKSVLEKINDVIRTSSLKKEYENILKDFYNNIVSISDIGEDPGSEEDALRALLLSNKEAQLNVMVAHLIKNNRYKDEAYKELVEITVFKIKEYYYNCAQSDLKEILEEKKEINGILEDKKIENIEFKKLVSELNEKLSISFKNEKDHLIKITELEGKIENLTSVLKRNEPLQLFFYRVITENNFILVTKDLNQFIDTPFESVTILPSDFKKNIKSNLKSSQIEDTVFVSRSSFTSGSEWYKFKSFLENNLVNYEELGQYEVTFYIEEIIKYFNRKEVLIYADEI